MIKNPVLKNALLVLAVLVSVPIMLTLLFLFYALIFNFFNIIFPVKPGVGPNPYFFLRPVTLFVILAIVAWFLFRSNIATLVKAIYVTLPVAAVLAFTGIYFDGHPAIIYPMGAVFVIGVLAYLFFTRKSWLYYFSVIPVAITMFLVQILGVEI